MSVDIYNSDTQKVIATVETSSQVKTWLIEHDMREVDSGGCGDDVDWVDVKPNVQKESVYLVSKSGKDVAFLKDSSTLKAYLKEHGMKETDRWRSCGDQLIVEVE